MLRHSAGEVVLDSLAEGPTVAAPAQHHTKLRQSQEKDKETDKGKEKEKREPKKREGFRADGNNPGLDSMGVFGTITNEVMKFSMKRHVSDRVGSDGLGHRFLGKTDAARGLEEVNRDIISRKLYEAACAPLTRASVIETLIDRGADVNWRVRNLFSTQLTTPDLILYSSYTSVASWTALDGMSPSLFSSSRNSKANLFSR